MCLFIENEFAVIDWDAILASLALDKADCHDTLYAQLCLRFRLTLLTDDRDFLKLNAPFMTGNQRTLDEAAGLPYIPWKKPDEQTGPR